MPRAAWCSRCGMYQWVNADGTCVNGHPADCLFLHHNVTVPGYPDDPMAPGGERDERTGRWLPVLLVAAALSAIALLGVVAVGAFTLVSHADQISAAASGLTVGDADEYSDSSVEESVDESGAEADDLDAVAESDTLVDEAVPSAPKPPAPLRKSAKPKLAAPTLDAFIARQYPDYRVEKRVSFPDQWEAGQLGVNYLLANKRHPSFRLLVSVAEKKADEEFAENHYTTYVGQVHTDDEVFSVDAVELNGILSHGAQNDLAGAIAAKLPKAGFVYAAYIESGGVHVRFCADRSPEGLTRAMQDVDGAGRESGEALLPRIPGREPITVSVWSNGQ
jgi:hypothetical protein